MYSTYNYENITTSNIHFASLMNDVISKGKSFRFQANGSSMFPFICNGDILTISPIVYPLVMGDIVAVFSVEQELFVHRVVRINKQSYLIKGDNHPGYDGWFSKNEIIGRVSSCEHKSKLFQLHSGIYQRAIAFLSINGMLIPFVQYLYSHYRKFRKGKSE